MKPQNLKILRWLTPLLALTLSIVSFAGAFLPAAYSRDSASMAAQGAGQDMVDLFLVVPLILLSYLFMAKGNRTAFLIYGGVVIYILYSFVIYAFGIHFNRFFLLYCATLGISLYTFLVWMSAVKHSEVVDWFADTPAKLISVYLALVALIFFTLWLKTLIPATLDNSVPAELIDNGLLVNPVHVIDLAFALPGLLVGSVLLWRRKGMGYIIASLALVFMILLSIALAAMVIMLAARGISEDFTVAVVFGILSIASLCLAILMFRKIS
jgi:hypothetical protein